MSVEGLPQLRSRLKAISPNPAMMRALGISAVAEQKKLVPRRTGNLGRSIGIGSVTPTVVETIAGANYATFVELGTRPHEIVPKRAKVLRFAVGGNARLSGTPRKGAPVVFARRVRHPGTKAHPFMLPGAREAARGFADIVIGLWNKAG